LPSRPSKKAHLLFPLNPSDLIIYARSQIPSAPPPSKAGLASRRDPPPPRLPFLFFSPLSEPRHGKELGTPRVSAMGASSSSSSSSLPAPSSSSSSSFVTGPCNHGHLMIYAAPFRLRAAVVARRRGHVQPRTPLDLSNLSSQTRFSGRALPPRRRRPPLVVSLSSILCFCLKNSFFDPLGRLLSSTRKDI
jgi:hypothetical protein